MYEVTVENEFCAAHALLFRGRREPLHGHNFRVWATLSSPELDGDGLVCDFHALQRALAEILRPLSNQNLHDVPPFDRVNPTAELIARHIGERLDSVLSSLGGAPGIRLVSVRLTEAPGCVATYNPSRPGDR
ncbi:MAG: 6-carboxytetrahydropterin synthase [Phycisphaerales bacterium]|nr:6-carboxytetrahydropterin synthase [Phycisphaerales bacterium]